MTATTLPTFADETAIRQHYQRMLESWEHGAEAYAECFTPDVAQIVAYGHIVYKDHRSSEQNKRTVYTITARRDPAGWTFVSYQNTPLGTH